MSSAYQKSSNGFVWVIATVLLLVVLMLVGLARSQSSANKTNRELALACTTDMATQFHIHPHLSIVVNGEEQEIPPDIGIDSGCMHPLHTHDASGKIHVEAPQKRDFTLSDFFAVWNKPFDRTQILDSKVDDTHRIRETVNGKEVQDYENTILHDDDQIVIYYENKPAE